MPYRALLAHWSRITIGYGLHRPWPRRGAAAMRRPEGGSVWVSLSGRAGVAGADHVRRVGEGRAASGGVVDEQHIQARQDSERRGVPDARQRGHGGIDTVAGGAGDSDGPHVADPETMGERNRRDHTAAHDAHHGLPIWRLGGNPPSPGASTGKQPPSWSPRAGLVVAGRSVARETRQGSVRPKALRLTDRPRGGRAAHHQAAQQRPQGGRLPDGLTHTARRERSVRSQKWIRGDCVRSEGPVEECPSHQVVGTGFEPATSGL